jgi:hypothetical protein
MPGQTLLQLSPRLLINLEDVSTMEEIVKNEEDYVQIFMQNDKKFLVEGTLASVLANKKKVNLGQ